MSILVIGVGTQIGLEIIRSLGKYGVSVYGAGPGKNQLGFYSKYIGKKFILPFSPEEVFIERLFYILKKIQKLNTSLPLVKEISPY